MIFNATLRINGGNKIAQRLIYFLFNLIIYPYAKSLAVQAEYRLPQETIPTYQFCFFNINFSLQSTIINDLHNGSINLNVIGYFQRRHVIEHVISDFSNASSVFNCLRLKRKRTCRIIRKICRMSIERMSQGQPIHADMSPAYTSVTNHSGTKISVIYYV